MWTAARNLLLSPVLLWVAPLAEDGASAKQCHESRKAVAASVGGTARDRAAEGAAPTVGRRASAFLP